MVNVLTKLMGFALALLLLFGGGFALGRAVGPVGAGAPPAMVEPSSTSHSGAHP